MITEDYVSFEIAKLLKEKGFDEPCESAYTPEGQYCLSCYLGPVHRKIRNSEAPEYSYGPTAPTLQITMKWLRKVHHLFIFISTWKKLDNEEDKYYYEIRDLNNSDYETLFSSEVGSYEQTCESAIKYCLKNLI
jgi:hypothetical protein